MVTPKRMIALIVAILLLGLILLIPITTKERVASTETYYEKEPYNTTETYFEKEPYSETENYTVSEPYTTTETYYEITYVKEPFKKSVPFDFIVKDSGYYISWFTEYVEYVTVQNTDTADGNFSVTISAITTEGNYTKQSDERHLSSQESFTFRIIFPGRHKDSSYVVNAPFKEITEYRDVPKKVAKQRTVTKYRDVHKTREVTKYRDVEKQRQVTNYRDVPKQRTVWNEVVVQKPIYKVVPEPLLALGFGLLVLLGVVILRKKSDEEFDTSSKEQNSARMSSQMSTPQGKSPYMRQESKGVIDVKSTFSYKGATIQYKVKVENPTSEPIADVKVSLYVPDVFLVSESTKSIAMLKPGESKTVTYDIRPTGECGDCEVSGKVIYYDYSAKKTTEIGIPAKSLSIVCPMLKVKEISESEWHSIVSKLVETEESTREIDMPAEALFTMVSRIVKDMHMYQLNPEITESQQLFNGVARFYGEGVKGLRYAAQVEAVGGAKKSKLIIKTWAEKEEALTGFYHGLLDEIEKRVQVKEYIDTPLIQQFYHYGDNIGTLVKDSIVQRSTIGTGARKCPNCGREAGVDEKFCTGCGARLEV